MKIDSDTYDSIICVITLTLHNEFLFAMTTTRSGIDFKTFKQWPDDVCKQFYLDNYAAIPAAAAFMSKLGIVWRECCGTFSQQHDLSAPGSSNAFTGSCWSNHFTTEPRNLQHAKRNEQKVRLVDYY